MSQQNISSVNDLVVNNNFTVAQSTVLNNATISSLVSSNINTTNLVVNSLDINSQLNTIQEDIQINENDIQEIKNDYALITYVDQSIANLVGTAPDAYNTLGEIATILQTDGNNINSLLTQIGTKANDNNVVHLDQTETITGQKQFNGKLVLNSNLKANNIEITPTEISQLTGVSSSNTIQNQLNTLTSNIGLLQPQIITLTISSSINIANYRQNCIFLLNGVGIINVTLSNPLGNEGKIFWISNITNNAGNIIANTSYPLKVETTAGQFASLASISIYGNNSVGILSRSDGYTVFYNSNVVSQYGTKLNTYLDVSSSLTGLLNGKSNLSGSNYISANNTYGGTNSFQNGLSSTVISLNGSDLQTTLNTTNTNVTNLTNNLANNYYNKTTSDSTYATITNLNTTNATVATKANSNSPDLTSPNIINGIYISNYASIPTRALGSQRFGCITSNFNAGCRDVNFWNVGSESQTDSQPAFTFEKINSDNTTERNLAKLNNNGDFQVTGDIQTSQVSSLNSTINTLNTFLNKFPKYSLSGGSNSLYSGNYSPTRPLQIQFQNSNGNSSMNSLSYPCVFRITCYFYRADNYGYAGQTTCDLMILPGCIRQSWGTGGSTKYNINNNINGAGAFSYIDSTYAPYHRQYWTFNQNFTVTSGANAYLSGTSTTVNGIPTHNVAIYFIFNDVCIYNYTIEAIDISSALNNNLNVSFF